MAHSLQSRLRLTANDCCNGVFICGAPVKLPAMPCRVFRYGSSSCTSCMLQASVSSLLLIICMVIDYPWPKTQTSGVPNMRIILPLPRTAGSEQQQQQCNSNSSCSIDWGKCVSVGLSRVSLSYVARVSHVSQRGIGHE